ncbi:MAG: biotin/lipoyl-binding protein, partial [Planctomycetota bacterium]|nr:biotin/lipoyl-binding protein [Planctomycetota bacterium]
MITLDESLVSSSRRRLELRLRRDLTIRQHFYQNKSSWVVKDPLSLKFYRFNDEEYAIVQLLDGNHSLEDIKFEFERRFAPNQVSVERLWQFIASLHQGGLLLAETHGQGTQLKQRRDERKHKELLAKFISPLSIKFRGINPDPILNVLYPLIRWVYSPIVVLLCVATMCSALLLVTVQHAVLAARLPAFHEFFSFQSAIWMMLALSLSKVIHEFGHALTCKHFGGECHEMGMMFLVLTPAAYCNVSDAWMLPNKWHRIAISVAGIYSDLMIASIATFLWWYSGPGLFNHFCLNLMFVCSVSTLLFNANPLMRFDGYYVLADLVEIPNLMQKASSVLARTLQIVCLGITPPPDPMLPQRNHGFFVLYAVGVTIYRWLIVISITMFLTQVFKPYGLQIFGQMLAVSSIAGMTIRPLYKVFKYLKAPGRWATVKKPRLIATFVFLGIVVAVIAGVPFSHSVYCPLEIRPRDSVQVYVDESGIIERVYVRAGDRVRQGDRLVDLRSSAIDLEESRLATQRETIESRLRQLHRQSFADPNIGSQIAETEASLAAVKQQIELTAAK